MTWLVVWSSLLFALGLLLGTRLGIWLEERAAARKRRERREERRAARWLGSVRETRGGTVMPPEVAYELPPLALDPVARRLFPETSAEEWRAIEEHAIAYADDEPPPYAFPAWSLLNADQYADPPLIVQEDPESLTFWRHLDQARPAYAFPPWSLLNADPPTLGEEIQAMIANANAVPSVRWLDRLEGGQ